MSKINLKIHGLKEQKNVISLAHENLKNIRLSLTYADIEKFKQRDDKNSLNTDFNSKILLDLGKYTSSQSQNLRQGQIESKPKSRQEYDFNPNIELNNSRRNLIVNSGIRRKIYNIFRDVNTTESNCQPNAPSEFACWNCCHYFNNHPVGIPVKIIGENYYVRGYFCGYSCALRYLYPHNSDDYNLLQTTSDLDSGNDLWEQRQLLEMMYNEDYNFNPPQAIQIAPPRLALKTFGGFQSIEEYRANCTPNAPRYKIYKEPLISINYQVEETQPTKSSKQNSKPVVVKLDRKRVEEAHRALQQT